jgi:signal transduction histidine kinase
MGIEGIVFINLDHSAANISQFPTSSESGDSSTSGEENPSCDIYSSSVRHSSADGRIGNVDAFKIRGKQLRRMIRCHPHGVVLQIEADGTILNTSSDDSDQSGSNNERERLNRQVKQDMQTLGAIVPNISSAALYPLRDDSNGQWRSCIFAWSTNMERLLDKNQDLAYMQSFGHSLLSELARLEALAADHAKATFISSISHELRSPLHGILAVRTFL